MTFSPCSSAAPAPSPRWDSSARITRATASEHIGRRVGIALDDGTRHAAILRGWGAAEVVYKWGQRVHRVSVGRVAYVVNLHTFTR